MPVFKTPFNGYSVKFSPFYESRIAVATAQNFGILGNGRIHVLDLPPSPSSPFTEVASFDTADGVYDLTWSESHDSLLIAAIADGSVKIYDLSLPPTANPIRSLQEHTREVQSVDYNPVRRDSFISSSWDDSVKLWTLDRPTSVRTFHEHAYCVYSAVWNPRHGDVDAVSVFVARVWDVRTYRTPLAVLSGHGYAVRKLKFSTHARSFLVSCSYDMTVCAWDYMVEDALVGRYDHHTEFVVGVDMSVLVEGLMASTGWDELVYVWQHGIDPRAV
jgi:peroxin-7